MAALGVAWACALQKYGTGRSDSGETVDADYVMAMIDLLHDWEQHSLYSRGGSRVLAMME